jgi:hypothetical protein
MELFEVEMSKVVPLKEEEKEPQEEEKKVFQVALMRFSTQAQLLHFLSLALKQESPITFIASEEFARIIKNDKQAKIYREFLEKFLMRGKLLDRENKLLIGHYTNHQIEPSASLSEIETLIESEGVS